MKKLHSLKEKYFYKLFTNIIGLMLGFVTQLIIPRALGPKGYGDFNFLTNFFTQTKGFCEMGTSIGLYTKLSHRPKESGLVAFYFYFIGIVAILNLALVALAHLTGIYGKLWPDQNLFYVYLAAALVIFIWVVQIMDQINDAYALTVPAEIIKVFQKIIGVILIVLLFVSNRLNLSAVFFYNLFMLFILSLSFIWLAERTMHSFRRGWNLSLNAITSYSKEFYEYSHPLFTYALVGLVVGILDRWLLQVFSGSAQQGFFSLSFQIGAVCFLFSGAMTPLITREFSIAYGNKDLGLMAGIFRKHIPLLYSITALLACFVAVNADKVTFMVGGGKFKDATVAVAIMALYPIHQTYGHLSNSVFYATGQTKLYRNIGVIFNLAGLPIVYFLVAPKELFGLNAGANGLALKMVLLNMLMVNVQLYFNARFLKLRFWRYVGHQLFSAAFLLTAAVLASFGTRFLCPTAQENVLLGVFLSGIAYLAIVVVVGYFFPVFFGLKREDVESAVRICRQRLSSMRARIEG